MEENLFQQRSELSILHESVENLKNEIGKIIVGQDEMIDLLLTAMLADGHVLIEGVPGVAKTLTAKLLCKAISVGFGRIQFTPDLMPGDVIGTSVFNSKEGNFQFRPGPIFNNLVLIDEINRAPAKTQAALFEVMEERQVTVDGQSYKLKPPFMVVATQNPVEHEGTYRLPEGQLDRFLFKIVVNYPSQQEEVQILQLHHQQNAEAFLQQVNPVLSAEQLEQLRSLVKQVHVEQKLLEFIAQIVINTRNNKNIYLGGSPRASIGILRAVKAFAALQGRDFVTPEDIIYIAPSVLRHRIVLSPEKEMEGTGEVDVIREVIHAIEVPR